MEVMGVDGIHDARPAARDMIPAQDLIPEPGSLGFGRIRQG